MNEKLTYFEVRQIFRLLLKGDVKDVIKQGFKKLDINNTRKLSVKIIRQGLFINR